MLYDGGESVIWEGHRFWQAELCAMEFVLLY